MRGKDRLGRPRHLWGGLDPEQLGNVSELVAQIVDGGLA
jgi:hypothetical protein